MITLTTSQGLLSLEEGALWSHIRCTVARPQLGHPPLLHPTSSNSPCHPATLPPTLCPPAFHPTPWSSNTFTKTATTQHLIYKVSTTQLQATGGTWCQGWPYKEMIIVHNPYQPITKTLYTGIREQMKRQNWLIWVLAHHGFSRNSNNLFPIYCDSSYNCII